MTLIIDTSQFAGEPDWSLLYARGARGVIVRGSSGPSHRDTLLDKHLAGATRAGIAPIAVYAYCYSWHPGEMQAAFAVQVAASVGLPVCGDFERSMSGPPRPTDEPRLARVTALAWLRHHRSLTGRAAVVYGPVHYLRDMKLSGDDVGPLWAADTRASRRELGPEVPPPWSSAVLWQHVHDEKVTGAAPGTTAAVDWNRSELTIEQLQAAFRGDPVAGFDTLGPVLAGVRAAEGRGATADTFVSHDEGPRIG